MKFSYKSQKDGHIHEGILEAEDRFDLYRQVKKNGEIVVSVKELKPKSFTLKMPSLFERVKMHDKIIFARNIGSMITAGLSLSRSIAVIEKQTKNKKLKKIYSSIGTSISQGKTFDSALAEYPKVFNNLFVSMVKAGQESGSLAQSLKEISSQLEKTYNLQKKIKSAMMYPAIILGVIFIIGILMLTFVIPRLTDTFKELHAKLPLSTTIVIAVSDFFKNHYLVAFTLIILITVGIIFFARTNNGKKFFAFIFLHVPVIKNIVKESNSARMARTLSSLLSSGVDLVLATQITADVLQNFYYKRVLEEAKVRIEKGEPLSTIFIENESLFPVFVGEMMNVGEETGQLVQMLTGVAVFYENEVEEKTKDLSTIIEPVLMVIIGATVGFFAISMITPMYTVMNNI